MVVVGTKTASVAPHPALDDGVETPIPAPLPVLPISAYFGSAPDAIAHLLPGQQHQHGPWPALKAPLRPVLNQPSASNASELRPNALVRAISARLVSLVGEPGPWGRIFTEPGIFTSMVKNSSFAL